MTRECHADCYTITLLRRRFGLIEHRCDVLIWQMVFNAIFKFEYSPMVFVRQLMTTSSTSDLIGYAFMNPRGLTTVLNDGVDYCLY